MVGKLIYYCHRFGKKDGEYVRALDRRCVLSRNIKTLWAPWLVVVYAEILGASIDEEKLWKMIEASIELSDGILLDLDGGPISPGMRREKEIAERLGKTIEIIE